MRLALVGWLSLVVLACGRPGSPAGPAATAPASVVPDAPPPATANVAAPSASSAPLSAGPGPPPLSANVHLPDHLAPDRRVPLLLLLHSVGTSAEDIESRTDWARFADRKGVAWIAPNGPFDSLGRRFWDAGPSCCNFSGPPLDHVSALRELVKDTIARYPIDRERVFVGGISNGGFMAHRLACAAPELIRGVVSISGAGPLEPTTCGEPSQLRVLEIHGDADPMVAYGGGHLMNDPKLPEHASVQKTMTDWAARLGCDNDPGEAAPIDLEKRFPGAETRVSRYAHCQRGSLELWTVHGGNHYLAFYEPAPELIWQFLTRD